MDGSYQLESFLEAIDDTTKHLAVVVAEEIRRPRLHALGCRMASLTVGGFSKNISCPTREARAKCRLPLTLPGRGSRSLKKPTQSSRQRRSKVTTAEVAGFCTAVFGSHDEHLVRGHEA